MVAMGKAPDSNEFTQWVREEAPPEQAAPTRNSMVPWAQSSKTTREVTVPPFPPPVTSEYH